MDTIFSRISVRQFEDRAVEPEKIDCSLREGLPMPEYAEIDCAIATENILLEIEAQGLGGVMLGIAPHADRMETVGKAVSLPERLAAFAVVAFGYPAKRQPQKDRYDASRVHYVK